MDLGGTSVYTNIKAPVQHSILKFTPTLTERLKYPAETAKLILFFCRVCRVETPLQY